MSTTIAHSVAHSDVRNLCYQMLAQFREMYKSSPAEAMLRYNYDSRDADKLVSMSHEELVKMADRGRLCFSLELPTERVLHAV